jgi:cysteine desulfurase / selenocysteine lyase
MSINDYLDDEGFIKIPEIVKEKLITSLFSGLLPNIVNIRQTDFPLFDKLGRVYLDSTATSQEPQSVKDKMHEYRKTHIRGSNHSRNSAEAREAQERFEETRETLRNFFHASNYSIGFTSGTTDGSNWVATRFPFCTNDLLIITEMEHNSQILTARNFAESNGVDIAYVPIALPEGKLNLDFLKDIVKSRKNKGKILLNLVHASNVSGVINPIKEIREILGNYGFIYLDMAQSAGHIPIDLDDLDVDFANVSSHKMYGPMGVGAIFVNNESKRFISTKVSGGSAIKLVSRFFVSQADEPARFEPGTQDLEGIIEWKFALDYVSKVGMQKIENHDKELGKYFIGELSKIKGVRIYGPKNFKDRTATVTFNLGCFIRKNYDDVASELDKRGISVRDGCFCAHIYTSQLIGIPRWMQDGRTLAMNLGLSDNLLKLPGAVRASFAFYNNLTDAYTSVEAIKELSGV